MSASKEPWENRFNFLMVVVVFGALLSVGWFVTLQRGFVLGRGIFLIGMTAAWVAIVAPRTIKWVRTHAG